VRLAGIETPGFVMVEQARSVDWCVRGAAFIEAAPPLVLHDVKLVLGAMLDFRPRTRPPHRRFTKTRLFESCTVLCLKINLLDSPRTRR
jgi:hypothetical protein